MNHPKIRQDMTFLVRHLQPGPTGIPIEIYVFSSEQAWPVYEGLQADIFDHILQLYRNLN
jgi:miniconductance mechanosensitive channel